MILIQVRGSCISRAVKRIIPHLQQVLLVFQFQKHDIHILYLKDSHSSKKYKNIWYSI